ncbi:MAG: hypothetical protein LAO09_10920 [Acidobacteriia bacterium]|nr:hypothetical protein [Terriglobia bacterium]
MKKSRAKMPTRSSKRASSEKAEGGAVDLVALRQQITALVGNEALRMVAETVRQVHKGHYQALKYLFEMVGLYPASGTLEAPGEDSLAATLLNYLGVSESTKKGETARLRTEGGVTLGEVP